MSWFIFRRMLYAIATHLILSLALRLDRASLH